jgi:hypothetical protein
MDGMMSLRVADNYLICENIHIHHTLNPHTMYTVTITNPNPAIGAKCRMATFSENEDAYDKFCKWQGWLDAKRDPALCSGSTIVAVGDDGYIVTITRTDVTPPASGSTCEDIDFDTRS